MALEDPILKKILNTFLHFCIFDDYDLCDSGHREGKHRGHPFHMDWNKEIEDFTILIVNIWKKDQSLDESVDGCGGTL